MIVTCEQCQTRFKIPDEKVSEKGVKVRCTKCGNTFRVSKHGAPSAAAAPTSTQTFPPVAEATSADPFLAFGRPPSVPDDEATRPGVFALGVEATRVPEIGKASAPPARPAGAFDFSSLAPPTLPSVPRVSAPEAAPFDFASMMTAPAPAPPPTTPFDFSSLGGGAPAAALAPAVALAAPLPEPPAFDFSSLDSVPGASASAVSAPPVAPVGVEGLFGESLPELPAPIPGGSQPGVPRSSQPGARAMFGEAPSELTAPIPGGSQPGFPRPSQPGARAMFGEALPELSLPIPGGSQPGIPRSSQPGARAMFGEALPELSPPIPGSSQPGIPRASQPGARAMFGEASPRAPIPGGSQPGVGGPFDGPAPESVAPPRASQPRAVGSADDFFGAGMSVERGAPVVPEGLSSDAVKDALFDMPVAAPVAAPEPGLAEDAAASGVGAEGPSQPRAAPRPSAFIPPPGPSTRRTALGVAINLLVAAVLVVALVVVGSAYLNEGKVSASTVSWKNLKSAFFSDAPFLARDVSNGLYDTSVGRPVFYVRGEVVNRGQAPVRILVEAELLEGDRRIRAAGAAAGAPPTPEELYLLATAEDVDGLDTKVTARAPEVAPGASAPFVVPFYEYPSDLTSFRVRVSARAAP